MSRIVQIGEIRGKKSSLKKNVLIHRYMIRHNATSEIGNAE
jgi:hypothetical protein